MESSLQQDMILIRLSHVFLIRLLNIILCNRGEPKETIRVFPFWDPYRSLKKALKRKGWEVRNKGVALFLSAEGSEHLLSGPTCSLICTPLPMNLALFKGSYLFQGPFLGVPISLFAKGEHRKSIEVR